MLIDPEMGHACIIDVDGRLSRKVSSRRRGHPDFIAPEVVKTSHLSKEDPNRVLPSISTDRHALSVLIYMYLFFRHPLRGGKYMTCRMKYVMRPYLWVRRHSSLNIRQTKAMQSKSVSYPPFHCPGLTRENSLHHHGPLFDAFV
uniref:Kinase protein n=1 Tax=Escherichia coli TaxID=562 RepID=A0A6G9HHV5_ECOLX|nr:Putative kinase protein [Escherichia coli]